MSEPNEGQLRAALDLAPDAIGVQRDGIILYANRGLARLAGFSSPEELVGTSFQALLPERHREAFLAISQAIPTLEGESNRFEGVLLKKDGTELNTEFAVTRIPWGDGSAQMAIMRDISPRKKAEQETVHTHNLMETVLDALPFSIYLKTSDLKFSFVNQTFARLNHVDKIKVRGEFTRDVSILGPEELALVIKGDQQLLQTGAEIDLPNIRFDLPDGSTQFRRGRKIPLRDEKGVVTGLVGFSEDITEQVRNQEALAQSEWRFRQLVEGSIQGVAIMNSKNKFVFANQAFADMFGYPDPEAIFLLNPFQNLVAPEDQERLKGYQASRFRDEKVPEGYEFRGIRADGTKIWLQNLTRMVEWQGKRAVQITIQDITRRKQAEESAQSTQRLLTTVLDTIPYRVFVKDRDCNYLMVNQAVADFLGKPMDQIIGDNIMNYLPKGEKNIELDERRLIATGERHDKIEEITNPHTGNKEFARVVKLPLHDDTGQIIGLVGVAEDFTAHRQIEDQLRQAQKMEAVGQLAGGVAHDFNNLLTILIGNLELSRKKIAEGKNPSDNVNRAMDAANRGANLTHRLLAFSRRQALQPEVTDLNKLIREQMVWLGATLGESIEIEITLAEHLWLTLVDPNQMELTLTNLALNARDAMDGEGRLGMMTANRTIAAGELLPWGEAAPGDYVMVAVEDSGPGIDPEIQEKIFEPFFTTKEVDRGSGLGLSMVYGFVNQSHGHVYVDTTSSGGTRICVLLPRIPDELEIPTDYRDTRAGVANAPSTEPLEGMGEAILVIEDNPNVRRLAVAVLNTLGFLPLEAQNGAEAYEVLADNPSIRLVFSDVVLPGGISGIDIAKRALQDNPELKILLTSGYTEFMANQESWRQPGLKFIQKPYRIEDLASMLGEMIAERERRLV